ncbi:ROK family transcriptional regulator [Micromonospora chersina]|uniref:Sugar kinase of the NBD/HSP70 family, may contain an N-terminal HTH domain n=1 Tax=Micromonospora chersina TaxID=47854 RepID=A0A1C6U7N1_9ACTN|nr:ROK family transcriptional regulator [Micromonospora chersina]SCL49984.1 Sugar kinase of the NBD/HSP70 family, may contain an N-terminal HTH domain [Micromonospora chersina]
MESAKPSVDLVRSLTDEHVLRALMRHRRLTRAELAVEIGISKPTAGESVRRLTELGLVADTGERTPGGRGRGRVGSYYALAPTVGVALAVTIAPEGVAAECVDVYADTVARAARPIDRPAQPRQVSSALRAAAAEAGAAAGQPARLAVVGAVDPVDRATGRLVHLPDAPFLVGELDPVAVLAPHVEGPVVVDNDVNWAALAERDSVGAEQLRDFAYLYLGDGLGCAIVNDGQVRRGRTGLTGEIAHVVTAGPGGRAVRFIELFEELGLRLNGSTAIDTGRLLASSAATQETIGTAVSGVVAAVIALADPQEVVVGGSWGPALIDSIRAATALMPRQVSVRPAELTSEPVLAGVRAEALRRLRASVTASSRWERTADRPT